MIDFLKKIAEKVEGREIPFYQYFFLFFAILSVRLCLEFWSSRKLFQWADYLHIGLWFTFIVLAFILILHFFSGERIERVAKLVITFFSLALTAPILDLIITGGAGASMAYMSFSSPKEVLMAFLTVGGRSYTRGATPGIRIEILLLVISSYHYFRVKDRGIVRSLLGAFFVYATLFFSGVLPYFWMSLRDFFQLTPATTGDSMAAFLGLLIMLMLGIAFLRYNQKLILLFFKSVKPLNTLLFVLVFVLGMLLSREVYPQFDIKNASLIYKPFFVIGAGLCLAMWRYLSIRRSASSHLQTGTIILGSFIAGLFSFHFLFCYFLMWALLFLLHHPSAKLFGVPVLNPLLRSGLLVVASFSGFIFFGGALIAYPPRFIFIILLLATINQSNVTSLKKFPLLQDRSFNIVWLRIFWSILLFLPFLYLLFAFQFPLWVLAIIGFAQLGVITLDWTEKLKPAYVDVFLCFSSLALIFNQIA